MTDWHRARCIGYTKLFFSEKPDNVEKARGICERCPIRRDCLTWALEHREAYGVWAGLVYSELKIVAASRGYEPASRDDPEHGTEKGWAWHRRQRFSNPDHEICAACVEAYNEIVNNRMKQYRKRKRRDIDFDSH